MYRFPSDSSATVRFSTHHHNFTSTALNQALLDRTRLAIVLYDLLTAVQLGDPALLAQAEEQAVAALVAVGGEQK